jgi:hypothetical protein
VNNSGLAALDVHERVVRRMPIRAAKRKDRAARRAVGKQMTVEVRDAA